MSLRRFVIVRAVGVYKGVCCMNADLLHTCAINYIFFNISRFLSGKFFKRARRRPPTLDADRRHPTLTAGGRRRAHLKNTPDLTPRR